jgi:PKHD-type hydroxylase
MRAMAQPDPPKIFDFSLGGFSATELDRLETYCDRLDRMRSALTGPEGYDFYNDSIRACQVAQVPQNTDTVWIYERLADIIRSLNNRSFRFDLRGFSEPPQYMVYHGTESSHFDWHMDTGSLPPRKLSLTLQLSDPSAYKGGDLQFNTGTVSLSAPRDRGAAVAFPSHTIHRVTPTTFGIRKAIVAWITGPEFR